MLKVEPIPAFDDNYIWLLTADGEEGAYVVDPGDAAAVEQALAARNLQLKGILITHHHFDHTGGIEALKQRHKIRVYGPDNPAITGIDQICSDGDILTALGAEFEVISIPGHTLDHIAYVSTDPQQPLVFCGDTLFAGGCGRVFEGTPQMMHQSLQRLAGLAADTAVYCAHEYTLGNLAFAAAVEPDNAALSARIEAAQQDREQGIPTVPSTLALEMATNPFMRCDQASVQLAAQTQDRSSASDPASVFAAVRNWKDNF